MMEIEGLGEKPSKELVVATPVELASKNIEILPYGLKFVNSVTKEEWNTAFLSLQHANTIYQWYLGDLVAQAEYQWKGEMYDLMMESTGLERQTLAIFSSVARAYTPDVRQAIYDEVRVGVLREQNGYTKLSFSHFLRAASLMNSHKEQAIDFLIRAGREGWSTRVLEEQIARWKNGGQLPEPRERAELELPDGWRPLRDAPKDLGYVPAPDRLDDEDDSPRVYLVLEAWELERLLQDYANDPTMVSLVSRLETALDGIR